MIDIKIKLESLWSNVLALIICVALLIWLLASCTVNHYHYTCDCPKLKTTPFPYGDYYLPYGDRMFEFSNPIKDPNLLYIGKCDSLITPPPMFRLTPEWSYDTCVGINKPTP